MITTLVYVAPGVDLVYLSGCQWETRWATVIMHLHRTDGHCVPERVFMN